MSTTPRTHAAKEQYLTGKMGIYGVLNEACQLETELNAMKAEFEKIILLAAQAADRNVELRRLAEKAEAEVANAVDGVIDGGSIPDTLLVIHIPRSPVGYRVGQPVKVILPAIDSAMKGTP